MKHEEPDPAVGITAGNGAGLEIHKKPFKGILLGSGSVLLVVGPAGSKSVPKNVNNRAAFIFMWRH